MRDYRCLLLWVALVWASLGSYAQYAGMDVAPDTLRRYPSGQSVGLVLSGGGAKGIAHVGVIQALEDHDIPIDYVAGTSMGAIIGGLYACGYTPKEMMALLMSPGFADWSTGTIDPKLTYYFMRQPQTPAFAHINVNLNPADTTAADGIIPSSLISPLPMNFAFMELFASYTAQCGSNFDRLFVPFRCVTSNVFAKHKVVLRQGMLSDAIRASMSFPCVFEPIKLDGVEMYDGGIYDNFPVDVIRQEFAPAIMIGVDVHSDAPGPSPNGIVNQLENMIIQNNDYELPADEGVKIHVDVSKFSLLDWGQAPAIYAAGYAKAMEMIDSIEQRVTSRIPAATRTLRRQVFKSQSPYIRFDSVSVSGGTPKQNAYIEHLFAPRHPGDTFGIAQARLDYYRAISPGKLRNLFPQAHYNPSTGLFALDLKADVKSNFALGAGGYLASSVNSMIFASARYSTLSFHSAEASLMGWLGQSYMAAQLDAGISMGSRIPSALGVEAVVSRQRFFENDKLFYQDNSPAFISTLEAFGRLNYLWAMGRSGKAQVGVGGGTQHSSFYANDRGDFRSSGRERTRLNLAQAVLRLDFNTLNFQNYPSEGYRLRLDGMALVGKYHYRYDAPYAEPATAQMPFVSDAQTGIPDGWNPERRLSHETHWFQAQLRAERYWTPAKHFSFGLDLDILASTRKLLNTYYASLVNAPAFAPLPSVASTFNKRYRANSYAALGIVPIWRPFQRAQLRLNAYLYLPFRRIEQDQVSLSCHYGRWFRNPEFLGELDAVYNLPFATLCAYVNYLSYPARNWNAGLSFGLYFTASHLLR